MKKAAIFFLKACKWPLRIQNRCYAIRKKQSFKDTSTDSLLIIFRFIKIECEHYRQKLKLYLLFKRRSHQNPLTKRFLLSKIDFVYCKCSRSEEVRACICCLHHIYFNQKLLSFLSAHLGRNVSTKVAVYSLRGKHHVSYVSYTYHSRRQQGSKVHIQDCSDLSAGPKLTGIHGRLGHEITN